MVSTTQVPLELPDPRVHPTMTVDEVRQFIPLSRSSAYAAIHSGELPSIRIGRLLLVPTAALLRMLRLDATPLGDEHAAG